MKNKPIIVVSGEPYSVFLEIFFKSLKNKKYKSLNRPILLICSYDLCEKQMRKLKYNFKLKKVLMNEIPFIVNKKNQINIFNVNFNFRKIFDQIFLTFRKSCGTNYYSFF